MTEPLVSVKMITYNHVALISRAIEGVLSQKTDFAFELVIGEDCSTDGTREIVFDYQRRYPDIIRVVTSDKNVGMRQNSNRTTKALTGKYIAWCEGDDYWHNPDKLQKQTHYLESHHKCGLVHSSYDLYDLKSKKRINDYVKYKKWDIPPNPRMADFVLARGGMKMVPLTCTVMARRALCEQIIASDPYLHQEGNFARGDMQLWAEISVVTDIHYIPESLATYNQTEESVTRSKDISRLSRLQISDADLNLYLCHKYGLSSDVRNEIEERRYNGLLRLAFHTRNAKLADEARKCKKKLKAKEWFLYWGAQNSVLYYPFRLGAAIRNALTNQ